MPELPEVEVIRRGLAFHLAGRRIVAVTCGGLQLRLPLPKHLLAKWISGARVAAVDRRAKYLLIRMDNGAVLVVHLGMSGKLRLCKAASPRARHDHLWFLLDNEMELRFNDTRRFGSVQVLAPAAADPQIFEGIGPEPFGEDFNAAYLLKKALKRTQPVKNFLMDYRVVAGIGNIYASEILFKAGIDPRTSADALDRNQWAKVIAASRDVLGQAIECGGTTIADFVNCTGEAGGFQRQLQVYGRAKAACRHCGTPIDKIVLAGRATYYCSYCQT